MGTARDKQGQAAGAPPIERYFGRGYYALYRHFLLPPEQTEAEVSFIVRKLRPRAGQRWLDLPCGYGRHLQALQACGGGLRLAGGDLNFQYLKEPGLRRAAGVTACDMRRLPFADRSFHGIINLLNSFGYYPPRKSRGKGPDRAPLDDRAVLGEWARVLRPGGRLVMDLANRRVLIGLVGRQPLIRYCGGGYEVIERFAWDPEAEVMNNQTLWRWAEGEERAAYHLRLYKLSQIERMLGEAGFAITDLYGDFTGEPFNPYQSDRMLVFARRAG